MYLIIKKFELIIIYIKKINIMNPNKLSIMVSDFKRDNFVPNELSLIILDKNKKVLFDFTIISNFFGLFEIKDKNILKKLKKLANDRFNYLLDDNNVAQFYGDKILEIYNEDNNIDIPFDDLFVDF